MSTTARHGHDAGAPARERLRAATDLSERHVTLAGVSTAILEGGQGPPMVLLHGQGEFWAVWMQVIRGLRSRHHVVVVDLPGHGTSRLVQGRLTSASMLQWVDELLEDTCADSPVLVGHLLGGAMAARYAVQHGPRLAHLVLVDTMGLSWYRPSPRFAIPMAGFVARPTEGSRDRLFRQCMLDLDRVGERLAERWEDLRGYALFQARTAENQAALRALMPKVGIPPIPGADLDRITVPTTLIHGRHDLQIPLRVAVKASERRGWPLHVIDGARDDPAVEQPAALLAALSTALTSHHVEEGKGR